MKFFSSSFEEKKSGILLFILCFILFLYVAVRSYTLSFTWDEAYCYLEFIRKGLFSPFYISGVSANNHLLNTWLSYLSSSIFGLSEFTLRIANLAAYALFLFYTAKISNEFSSFLLKISSFLILNLNPYMIDFFSLSRGYGISFGLMAGSLWYLYVFLKNNFQRKDSLRSLVFAMTAVFAYLTLVHFAIALFVVIFLIDFLIAEKEIKFSKRFLSVLKKNSVTVIILLFFLLLIIPRIIGLKNAGALFYGGIDGFWHDTVLTVFERSLYGKPYPETLKYLLGGFAFAVSIVSFIVSVKIINNKNISSKKLFIPVLFYLFLHCSLVSILQHYLLNTPHLTNRTALFLLVLFSFICIFLFNELSQLKKIFTFFLPVFCLLLTFHFCNCINLKYVLEYNLNADMKEMMKDIDSLKKETPSQKFNLDVGMSYDFLASFNYYRCAYDLTWLNVADKGKKEDLLNDYFLFTENEFKKIHRDSFVLIKTYPLFNNMLLRRKYKPSEYSVCLSKKLDYETPIDSLPLTHVISDKFFYSGKKSGMTDEKNEYSDGIAHKIDLSKTPVKNSMLLVKSMTLMEHLGNSESWLIVSFENKKEIYFWHATLIVDFATKSKEWFPVYYSCIIPEEVKQDDKLMIYLWNKKSPVYIDDLEMRWITGAY